MLEFLELLPKMVDNPLTQFDNTQKLPHTNL
jgi:hypothetical protein